MMADEKAEVGLSFPIPVWLQRLLASVVKVYKGGAPQLNTRISAASINV
jgi:hypothetical protein